MHKTMKKETVLRQWTSFKNSVLAIERTLAYRMYTCYRMYAIEFIGRCYMNEQKVCSVTGNPSQSLTDAFCSLKTHHKSEDLLIPSTLLFVKAKNIYTPSGLIFRTICLFYIIILSLKKQGTFPLKVYCQHLSEICHLCWMSANRGKQNDINLNLWIGR